MKPNKRSSNLNTRRKSSLERLEKQLKSKVKPVKMEKGAFTNSPSIVYMELTEKDIKRINSEIQTLKTKIK